MDNNNSNSNSNSDDGGDISKISNNKHIGYKSPLDIFENTEPTPQEIEEQIRKKMESDYCILCGYRMKRLHELNHLNNCGHMFIKILKSYQVNVDHDSTNPNVLEMFIQLMKSINGNNSINNNYNNNHNNNNNNNNGIYNNNNSYNNNNN